MVRVSSFLKYGFSRAFLIFGFFFQAGWVETAEGTMESLTTKAFGDGSAWGSGGIVGDAPASVEEGFSYKDKITADERDRWTSTRSMNQESDTEIEGALAREKTKSAVYQHLKEVNDSGSPKARPRYRDVHKESHWTTLEMQDVMENPEEVFTRTFEDCKREPVYKTTFEKTYHHCREGRPLTIHTCTRYLKKAQRFEKKKEFSYTQFSGDHYGNYSYTSPEKVPEFHRSWFDGCNWGHDKAVHVYTFHKREVGVDPLGHLTPGDWYKILKLEYDSEEEIRLEDEWVSNCEELEERTKEGLCRKVKSRCIGDGKTRVVDELEFTRDCWQEEFTYECKGAEGDTCTSLREQGCHQIASKCIEHRGPECVSFDVEMECLRAVKEPTGETHLVCGEAPFCMNGMCHREDYDPNKDLMEVMAKLKVLSATAKHMSGDADSLRIFTGGRLQCKKDMMSFRDCCNGGSGWGVGMNLAGCGGEEQMLAKKRSKGLCVEVGTYCAHKEKITKICLTKKTSFCCFPTKLLRIIQEQGRFQLGIGWGDPEHSDCRGLMADELSRVDFSRLNLREVEADLMGDLNVEKIDSSLRERLSQIQEGITYSPTFVPSLMESSRGREARETHSKEETDA